MARGNPPIFLRNGKYFSYYSNKEWPQVDTYYLREGEWEIVTERLKGVLTGTL